MASTSAIPLPLQKAIDGLPAFVDSIAKLRPGLIRSMRSDRKICLVKFLTVILLSTSLQHDGAICYINERWAKPKTLEEIAAESGISYSQAKRCLALMKELDFITSKQIKRKNRINGQFEVSPGLRFLTQKFWVAVGLWDLFKANVAWAKKHCRRYFLMPFKTIKLAEKTFKQVGGFVGNVLKTMQQTAEKEQTDGQKRAKFWCNKILTNLRQKK